MSTIERTLLKTEELKSDAIRATLRLYEEGKQFLITEEWSIDGLEEPVACGPMSLSDEMFQSNIQRTAENLLSLEVKPRSECVACKNPLYTDRRGYTDNQAVRMQRGSFEIANQDGEMTTGDSSAENIKTELYLCLKCWLTDPDLCAFFNRIGWRIR